MNNIKYIIPSKNALNSSLALCTPIYILDNPIVGISKIRKIIKGIFIFLLLIYL